MPKGRGISEEAAERELRKGESKAEEYARDPEKIRGLVDKAKRKADRMGPLGATFGYLTAMIRLLRVYASGEYRKIPWGSLLAIIAAVIYFVNPVDLIPDFVPGIGSIDDALVLAVVLKQVRADLDRFIEWEKGNAAV